MFEEIGKGRGKDLKKARQICRDALAMFCARNGRCAVSDDRSLFVSRAWFRARAIEVRLVAA